MPQVVDKSSPQVAITLHQPFNEYQPGDVIRGAVSRTAPVLGPNVRIVLRLGGRIKTKATGNTFGIGLGLHNVTETLRVVNERDNSHLLYQGPVQHVNQGEPLVWAFELIFPRYMDHDVARDLVGIPFKGLEHCLDPNEDLDCSEDEAPKLPLPPTIFTRINGGSFACVEYWIAAELIVQGTAEGKCRAVKVVNVKHYTGQPPIDKFKLRELASCEREISAPRLVPGMAPGYLPPAPTFRFNVVVWTPTVIQIDNPSFIPFRVRIDDPTAYSSVGGGELGFPAARLVDWSMRFCENTHIKGAVESTKLPNDYIEKARDMFASRILRMLYTEVYIPIGSNREPLDLGQLINLQLGPKGNVKAAPCYKDLIPSFEVHNVEHFHSLYWQITADVAGQQVVATGNDRVHILPPTEPKLFSPGEENDIWAKPFQM